MSDIVLILNYILIALSDIGLILNYVIVALVVYSGVRAFFYSAMFHRLLKRISKK